VGKENAKISRPELDNYIRTPGRTTQEKKKKRGGKPNLGRRERNAKKKRAHLIKNRNAKCEEIVGPQKLTPISEHRQKKASPSRATTSKKKNSPARGTD